MIAFGLVAAMSLATLWPHPWDFAADPRQVIVAYVEAVDPGPVDELYRDLALHMQHGYGENQQGLERLAFYFQIASGLLAIEVALWILAIASTA